MKKYTLIFTEENGKISSQSEADGYTWPEILGILEWKKMDIMRQITEQIQPDFVKRTRVVDEYPESYGEGGGSE